MKWIVVAALGVLLSACEPEKYNEKLVDHVGKVTVNNEYANDITLWTKDSDGSYSPDHYRQVGSIKIVPDVPAGSSMWAMLGLQGRDWSPSWMVIHVHAMNDLGDGATTDKHGSHPIHTLQ